MVQGERKSVDTSPFNGSYKQLAISVDARFIDAKNRPTLAQTFSQTAIDGEKWTGCCKSKGSDCADVGGADINGGQGNSNLTCNDAAMTVAIRILCL